MELELGQTLTLNLTATDSAGFGAIIMVTIEVVDWAQFRQMKHCIYSHTTPSSSRSSM